MIPAKLVLWITLAAVGYATVLAVTLGFRPTAQERYVEMVSEQSATLFPEITFEEPKSSASFRRRFPNMQKVTLRSNFKSPSYAEVRDDLKARLGRMGHEIRADESRAGHFVGRYYVPGLDIVDVDLWSSTGNPAAPTELIVTFTERSSRWP